MECPRPYTKVNPNPSFLPPRPPAPETFIFWQSSSKTPPLSPAPPCQAGVRSSPAATGALSSLPSPHAHQPAVSPQPPPPLLSAHRPAASPEPPKCSPASTLPLPAAPRVLTRADCIPDTALRSHKGRFNPIARFYVCLCRRGSPGAEEGWTWQDCSGSLVLKASPCAQFLEPKSL